MKQPDKSPKVPAAISQNTDYKDWLKNLKQQVLQTQQKAAVQVNSTLLQFYWQLGADIVKRQQQAGWGEGFLKQLSKDLMAEFPQMKGFSLSNIKYMRQWFLFYNRSGTIGQQL
ncbi:MAG: putative nuclease of restriction endonuclease-like (RecB) superfamily, partial [Alteromonadaceae bacterium]